MFSDLARQFQALYVPTSQLLLQSAQNRLLQHFCGGLAIEARRSQKGLNYIVVRGGGSVSAADRARGGKKTLVLIHGFGSGLGFFFANYRWLSTESYERVIAVDLLGMGGSERVSLEQSPRVTTSQLMYKLFTGNVESVDEEVVPRALDFFVESIAQFCDEVIEEPKFHVAGHSLGSLLSWNYALRHRNRVEALLMLSPCGVPAPPPGAASSQQSSSYALSFFRFMWDMNCTPQQIVRMAGSRGLPLVTSTLRRRFNSRWNEVETDLIAQYFYHITAAPASGEFSLNSLLRPLVYRDEDGTVSTSIFAKRPVETDIEALTPDSPLPFPVLLMFGDHDWLRFKNVERFVSLAESKGVRLKYSLIPTAGHHLYLDNPDGMHTEIQKFREVYNV